MMYKIGNLSEKTDISIEAIRYYERIGFIPKPQRADNGYRLYTDTDIERLNFIRRVRKLDIALDEILAFRERDEAPGSHVMTQVEGLKLVALTFNKDVSMLSCCAV